MSNLIEFLIKPYRDDYTTFQIILECIAVAFGIASVWFSKLRNIWVYPTGIISTGMFIYLLFNWGLYGDMLINVYYSIMSVYGWILWSNQSQDHIHVQVEKMTRKDWIISLGLFIFSFILVLVIYYFRPILSNNFDLSRIGECGPFYSLIDYTDCFTTSIFLVGMWTMAKRKIENWLFWIVGDLISIPMYIIKGYGITSMQYFVFLVLAIMGYIAWKKAITTESH